MTWTIDGCISMQNLDIVRGGNRIAMLDCENEALSDTDILANARLIAAAPDLLKAAFNAWADLEGIMPEFEPSGDREHPAWATIKELRAAITKAQGA
jgi:hypothetical protein